MIRLSAGRGAGPGYTALQNRPRMPNIRSGVERDSSCSAKLRFSPRMEMSRTRDAPRCGDVCKVGLGDPRVPVALKRGEGSVPVLELAKGPLVDDVVVPRSVEQAGGDPWLRYAVTREHHPG